MAEPEAEPSPAAPKAPSTIASSSDFFRYWAFEQALWPDQEHDHQQHHGDDVFVGRRDQLRGECFHEAYKNPAQNRARKAAKAAYDDADPRFHDQSRSDIGRREKDRHQHEARDSGE